MTLALIALAIIAVACVWVAIRASAMLDEPRDFFAMPEDDE